MAHSLRVLQPAQGGRPPTSSTQTCSGDRVGGRGSLFIREAVQKHPVPLSYILFYTQTQKVRVQQVKAISSRPPHGIDRAVNPREVGGRESRVSDLPICSLTVPRALVRTPLACTTGMHVSCAHCALAALCCWYRSVLAPIVLVMMQTGPPTSAHNSPLVCHACDQSC